MSKISNVLLLLQYLENGRKYSIKELAEKLEVSERMIRVYKEELEKAGIYIDSILGPYGGYVLNQSVRVPEIRFSKEDYEFLKNLKVSKDDQEQLDVLADKMQGISSYEKVTVKDEEKSTYNTLMRAMKEKRKVLINYYSYQHGYQERVIHPFELFYFHSGWGCAAFCEKKQDLRHFELARIKEIQLLDETF